MIIGAGAAGCFCAAELSSLRPDMEISILEAGPRPMAKLAITGGSRCNLTNSFEGVENLAEVYPRGSRLMRRALGRFGWRECCRWFEDEGVQLLVQDDHCVFPVSQDAMQIVRTLERRMRKGGVRLMCGSRIDNISRVLDSADAVVLATGGGTAGILEGMPIELVSPVPSLFTLRINDAGLRSLMGTVTENVTLGLAGTRFRAHGTLLLTDWGVSGPATLKLSSYAARELAAGGYKGMLLVNWLGCSEDECRALLRSMASGSGRLIINSHPPRLTERLWRHLVLRAGVREDSRWGELGLKSSARLVNTLISDTYDIIGRARFKEEFVTCGGVSLSEVRPESMESRKLPGLYFAGEVLDIDAVTGGFNLQAAWSTAWIAAHSIAEKY